MRLSLSLLFVVVMLAIPAVVLMDAAFDRESQGETAANRIGTPFFWPEHPRTAEPEVALRIIGEAATATGSNVLRTTVSTSRSERKRITHYIFLGRDRTALFDDFTLVEGRWLNPIESRGDSVTVSSARVGESGNVGVPAVFGDRYELTFAPLRRALDSLPSSGRYTVESPGRVATDRFLAIVHQRLVEVGVAGLTVADLTVVPGRPPVESKGSLGTLAYILAGLATLIIAFVLLREGKRIGVLRSVGHSATRIWYEVVGRLQATAILAGVIACLGVTLAFPGVDSLLLRLLAVTFLQVTVVGFVATLGVGLVVINRVQVSDLIKGSLQ